MKYDKITFVKAKKPPITKSKAIRKGKEPAKPAHHTRPASPKQSLFNKANFPEFYKSCKKSEDKMPSQDNESEDDSDEGGNFKGKFHPLCKEDGATVLANLKA
jgi:hypothetical protein